MNDRVPLPGTGPLDAISERQDISWVGQVDGMAGPEAHAVLAPRGYWPPKVNPLLVREVVVEPGEGHHPIRLRFIDA